MGEGEIVMRKTLRILLCLSLLSIMLVACNSSSIVGTWKPIKGDPCEDEVAEIKFTKENTVKYVTDGGRTFGGNYKEIDDNLYSLTLSQGSTADIMLSTEEGETTLDVTNAEGNVCQYNKSE